MCITVCRHGKCFWDGRPCATISVTECEYTMKEFMEFQKVSKVSNTSPNDDDDDDDDDETVFSQGSSFSNILLIYQEALSTDKTQSKTEQNRKGLQK